MYYQIYITPVLLNFVFLQDRLDNRIDFIRLVFYVRADVVVVAPIAPIMLVRIGMLKGKPFMSGVNKDEVMGESFSEFELEKMIGWDDNLANPIKEGYLITDKILTSVSYNFVKWGLAFAKMLDIEIPPATFGI